MQNMNIRTIDLKSVLEFLGWELKLPAESTGKLTVSKEGLDNKARLKTKKLYEALQFIVTIERDWYGSFLKLGDLLKALVPTNGVYKGHNPALILKATLEAKQAKEQAIADLSFDMDEDRLDYSKPEPHKE